MCLEAPLSTYQSTLDIVLENKQEVMENEVSNWDFISSTPATMLVAKIFAPSPFFFNGH
jgi:hypothetical protein